MTDRSTAGLVEASLAARLRQVLPYLEGPGDCDSGPRLTDAGDLIDATARHVCADPATDKLWLVLAATAGRLPTAGDVREAHYRAETSSPTQMALWMLDDSARRSTPASAVRSIRLVDDHVLVDAGARLHVGASTGHAQRGLDRHPLVPDFDRLVAVLTACWKNKDRYLRVAWDPTFGCWTADDELIVPWRTTVVVLGTTALEMRDPLAAAAEMSGSTFAALVDDNFPAASGGLIPDEYLEQTVHHLNALKHFSRVAALSEASAVDYRGFVSAMPAQGVRAPQVVYCALATDPFPPEPGISAELPQGCRYTRAQEKLGDTASNGDSEPPINQPIDLSPDLPTILCVGAADRRFNLAGLLCAADLLWTEGIQFELNLVVSKLGTGDFPPLNDRLLPAGRPIKIHLATDQIDLEALYATARFCISASNHEGMAIWTSEVLSRSIPVLSSPRNAWNGDRYTAGVMAVDIDDSHDLVAAIRLLLTDDVAVSHLRDEIASRGRRPWDKFSDELWSFLVDAASPPDDRAVAFEPAGHQQLPSSS